MLPGLFRPGRLFELAGAVRGLCREGLVAALGLASVPASLWWVEDGVVEVSPALLDVLAPRVSRLAGWPEDEVADTLREGYRAAAVFRGLLRAGFDLRSALGEILGACSQFPLCSDPVLLWFCGELSAGECLECMGAGRDAVSPRDVSVAWGQAKNGVVIDVALRCVAGFELRLDPLRVELLPRSAAPGG